MDSGSSDDGEEEFDDLGIECVQTLEGHSGQILCITALSDSRLATGGCYIDKTIRVWDTDTGEELALFRGFDASCLDIQGLDEATLCSGHEDGTIFVWDIPSGELRHELAGRWCHRAPIVAMCPLSSGTHLATSANCADRFVRIWNWAKRNECLHVLKPQVEIKLEGHDESLVVGPTRRGVRVSDIVDIGKDMIACIEWGAINVWSWRTSELVSTMPMEDSTIVRPLLYLGAGMAATGERSGNVVIYRLRDGEMARCMEGHTRAVWGIYALDDAMDCLATGSLDETIRVWKWRNCGASEYLCLATVSVGPIVGPAKIVPVGSHFFACGGEDEFVRIFSWLEYNKQPPGKLVGRRGGHIDTITALTRLGLQHGAGPRPRDRFATVSEDQCAKVWRLAPPESLLVDSTDAVP